MFDLAGYLRSKQLLVDARLEELLARESAAPALLREAMRYSLLAPGKRLRPALVFMACQVAGGADDHAWPAACAVEMIHTYSLIHDDLPAMDDDDLRRGLPTCHKKFGEALAILAGDALLTLAFQVLAEHQPGAGPAVLALAHGAGLAGMVGGQALDLAWERGHENQPTRQFFPRVDAPRTLEALEQIHHLKTGALFRASLRLGVLAAQGERADPRLLDELDQYARRFGLVFQITDDLLDVEGTEAETGKRIGKDADRGKLTYPGFLGAAESRRRAEQLVREACAWAAPRGEAALPLAALMEYLLSRRH